MIVLFCADATAKAKKVAMMEVKRMLKNAKNKNEEVAKGFPRSDQQKMSLQREISHQNTRRKDRTCAARGCKGNRKAQRERKRKMSCELQPEDGLSKYRTRLPRHGNGTNLPDPLL